MFPCFWSFCFTKHFGKQWTNEIVKHSGKRQNVWWYGQQIMHNFSQIIHEKKEIWRSLPHSFPMHTSVLPIPRVPEDPSRPRFPHSPGMIDMIILHEFKWPFGVIHTGGGGGVSDFNLPNAHTDRMGMKTTRRYHFLFPFFNSRNECMVLLFRRMHFTKRPVSRDNQSEFSCFVKQLGYLFSI